MGREAGISRLFGLGGIELGELFGLGEIVTGAVRWGKVKLFNWLFGANWWAELFDIIEDADTAKNIGVSPSAITSIVARYLEKTCEVSLAVGEEIGSESIMEMLSEGLSSAMETNFNASIQTILNVKRGSLPPDLSIALQIGQRLDRVEPLYAMSQLMPIGNLNYTILEALLFGADQRYINAIESALAVYDQAIAEKNQALHSHIAIIAQLLNQIFTDLVLDASRFIEALNTIVTSIADEHLARLNQLEDNVESAKALYDANMLSNEEYQTKIDECYYQLVSSETVYDKYINDVMNVITDYVNKLDSIKDDIVTLIQNWLYSLEAIYNAYINGVINAISSVSLDSELKSKALDLYDRLKAIRAYGYSYS